jgi:hypothetical protein
MKTKYVLLCWVALLGCVLGGAMAVSKSFSPPPSAKTVAAASSLDLAISYDGVRQLYAFLPMVESGMTIHTPEGKVTRGNVAKIRRNLEERLAVYRTEIESRGYVELSGVYSVRVTPPCAHTQSWLIMIESQSAEEVEISQITFEFKLSHKISHEGRQFNNVMEGVVVEDQISFRDSMNSDFVFIGSVEGRTITIRPDTDAVLASWPNWAGPPKRKDLNACVVTLTRH